MVDAQTQVAADHGRTVIPPAVQAGVRVELAEAVSQTHRHQPLKCRALAYDIEGLPPRLRRVANRWSLRPAGPASTEVTLTSTVAIANNPVARIAEQAAVQLLATQSDTMLAGLAARVEGSE